LGARYVVLRRVCSGICFPEVNPLPISRWGLLACLLTWESIDNLDERGNAWLPAPTKIIATQQAPHHTFSFFIKADG